MKSFATSICPIKKSSRSEYEASPRHPRAIPAPSPPHPRVADHPPTDLKTVSFRCHNRSSARQPCPQELQSHLRVAKQSSIGPSARRPCPEVSQRHPRVAKGASISTSARRPCLQMPQWHPRVAKRSSIRHSARQTCPQVPQRHHPVAVSNRSFTSACP